MISKEAKRDMTDIYISTRRKSGWVTDCMEAGFSLEDIVFLESLDDEFKSYQPEEEAGKFFDSEAKKAGMWQFLSVESDEEKIGSLSESISETYWVIGTYFQSDVPYREIRFLVDNVREYEKLRQKIRARHIHKNNPSSLDLPEWKIVNARQFPLENLVNVKKNNKIHCPFGNHESDTMWVRNGFGYCFSCEAWCDSIKWLTAVKGYSFKEAVDKLS